MFDSTPNCDYYTRVIKLILTDRRAKDRGWVRENWKSVSILRGEVVAKRDDANIVYPGGLR